jgi:DNA-binding transcriptional MerR regulator
MTKEIRVHRIGALARAVGKSPATIRLWERREILPPLPRDNNGHVRLSGRELRELTEALTGRSPK